MNDDGPSRGCVLSLLLALTFWGAVIACVWVLLT